MTAIISKAAVDKINREIAEMLSSPPQTNRERFELMKEEGWFDAAIQRWYGDEYTVQSVELQNDDRTASIVLLKNIKFTVASHEIIWEKTDV